MPPVNSIPAGQTTSEDTDLVFSAGNGNLISIGDPDAGSSSVQVTLTGTNGVITLSGITGLTFTVGDGTADAGMTFQGTIADINAALAGLVFRPTADYNGGGASLQIVTDDLGNTGGGGAKSDSDLISILVTAVNDAPTATIGPASYTATEQVALALHGTGLSVADIDAGLAMINMTLSVDAGNLTVAAGTTGVSLGGSGTSSVLVIGTLTQLNNLLSGNLGGTISYLLNSDAPPASPRSPSRSTTEAQPARRDQVRLRYRADQHHPGERRPGEHRARSADDE